MNDISNIKTGDIGFVYFKFDIKDINTWMSWFSRFFMNFQAFFLGKEKIKNQHCGIFAWVDGELYFYQSIFNGFLPVLATQFFQGKWQNLIIKRYDITANETVINNFKSKYNFLGILLQLIRQVSFNIIDLEAQKGGIKKTYCSQACGYLINLFGDGKYCQYWGSLDTQDLYFDKASKTITI